MSEPEIPKLAIDPTPYLSEQLRVIERLALGLLVLVRGKFEVDKAVHPQWTTIFIAQLMIKDGLASPSESFGRIEPLPRVIGLHARLSMHPNWCSQLRDDEEAPEDLAGGRGI